MVQKRPNPNAARQPAPVVEKTLRVDIRVIGNEVECRLTNVSSRDIVCPSMSCSWEGFWTTDCPAVILAPQACSANGLVFFRLRPGESRIFGRRSLLVRDWLVPKTGLPPTIRFGYLRSRVEFPEKNPRLSMGRERFVSWSAPVRLPAKLSASAFSRTRVA